jgi:hypothetical protein
MSRQVPRLLFSTSRLRLYPLAFLILYLVYAVAVLSTSVGNVDRWGTPIGVDFSSFYAVSKLTLAGEPEAAFDIDRLTAVAHAVTPGSKAVYQWAYPPTYQLLILPLALMPYGVALTVFLGLTFGAFAAALSGLPQLAGYRLALLCSPAIFLCAISGQNGMLMAALFAGGFALLERRPFWAGLLFAALAFKPQMGVLLPVALLAAGQWRTLLGTATGVFCLGGAATAVFGVGLWTLFFEHLEIAQRLVQAGQLPWPKITSAFVFFRYLGAPVAVAYAAQLLTALGAAVSVALVWRKRGPQPLAWAVLVSATLLVTPYMFLYEFVLLLIPLGIFAWDMAQRGAGRAEMLALFVPYGIGLVLPEFVRASHVQIGYLVLLMMLGLGVRRALISPHARDIPAALQN